MESFLNRYRNITVLLLVLFAQLVLLAVQVKNDQDVHLIRVWAVSAVTPAARIVEALRGGSVGLIRNYIVLRDEDAENRRLQQELGKLKLENIYLKNQVAQAERAQTLAIFQRHTPSKTLAATVIASGASSSSKVVFVDRGSVAGVMRGMAVVTPDGIVGKVIAAYPPSSEVLLVNDPDFAAGIIDQKTGVRGTLKGQGKPLCIVDYVHDEEKVEVGDWFYTSGDDRIFPRGFPVGVVKVVRHGQPFKEIYVEPVGLQHGLEDVLILLEGVHQDLPTTPPVNQQVYIAPPPPAPKAGAEGAPAEPAPAPAGTEADKLRSQYKAIGEAQNHKFGEGLPGSKPPNFNLPLPSAAGGQQPAASGSPRSQPAGAGRGQPAAPGTGQPAPAGRGVQPPATGGRGTGAAAPAVPKAGAGARRANQAGGGPEGPPH